MPTMTIRTTNAAKTVMLSLLFFWSSYVLTAAAAECDLDCQNGSFCMEGDADFSMFQTMPDSLNEQGTSTLSGDTLGIHEETSSSGGMHCSCPHGWTGLLCDVPWVGCDYSHRCYNGGRCEPGQPDKYGNEQFYCNCDTASDFEGNIFVGKWCEHKVNPATDFCGGAFYEEGDPQEHYCLSPGVCNLNYPQHGDQCECPSGTFGDHCECPEGWHGLYCQHKVEDCDGEGEHFCLHGSKCVKDSVTNQHACDCTEADQHSIGGFLFVGFSCEQATNTVCTKLEGDPIPGKPLSFCDNGGTCKKMVSQDEGHPGCDCKDGWKGPHCEYKDDGSPTPVTMSTANEIEESIAIYIFLTIISILLTLVVGICWWFQINKRQKKTKH